MKKKQIFIGIDVSKDKLDVYIYSFRYHFVVNNDVRGFPLLLETTCKVAKCKISDLFFCFENTGKYSRMLSIFLSSQKITFKMESALAIKKSLGITRGKNDRIDAKRIALYAFEKRAQLVPTILPGAKIERIKMLLSLREKLIKYRSGYKCGITDLNDCYLDGETDLLKNIQLRQIKVLNDEIALLENEIEKIIKEDPIMLRNYILMLSVKGVGKIIAFYVMAYTANFTLFLTPRAFACYCGIAPFEKSSGTVKGKGKVHHYANKQLKSLLNLAASSAIQIRGEYQQYYQKRILEQGKNKMSTLNIIRNKIVFRIFAVIKRGTPYVDIYKYVA